MATAKLYPTSTTDVSSVIAAGDHTAIDETSDVAGGDGNFCTTNTDQQTATFSFGLSDLPGNADTINTATLRVRARIVGLNQNPDQADLPSWTVSATNDGASVTYTAAAETGSERELTANLTAETVASLNSETITVDQTAWTQTKGPDGSYFQIEFIEIEVDYTEAAASNPNLMTLLGVG